MLQTDLDTSSVRAPTELAVNAPDNVFSVVGPDAPDRARLESRIRSGFGMHFGACIDGFMPRFALYQHASGATGVIGVRRASGDPLFLEQYLEMPIEQLISVAAGVNVNRPTIAEVGQFIVDDRDIVGAFFRDLVPFLTSEGFDWVCFTGTNRIRAILNRVGFRGMPVAAADAARVEDGDRWGKYYDYEPVVIVGRLGDPEGHWCANLAAPEAFAAGS